MNKLNHGLRSLILFISLVSASFGALARDFKIEEDQVFKTLISEFKKSGSYLALYQEAENYRFDLTLTDLVDRTSVVINDLRFKRYEEPLNAIIK